MKIWKKIIVGILVYLSATSALGQSAPMQIAGRITDATGVPATGAVDLEIKFFDKSSGGKQLGNYFAISGVPLTQGVFQAPINLSESEKTAIFGSGKPVFMEVTDATNGRTFPRQLFGAVPYAMRIPVDNKTLSFDNSGKLTIGSGSKNPGDVLTVDGSGNLSWGPAAGGIDPTGGSMTGDLDMGGTNTITNVADPVDPQDSATKNYVDSMTLKLGTFDAAGETTLISGLLPADEGKSWYNSTTNEVKYWNGSIAIALGAAGSGLANFNGEVGTTQSLGIPGSSGTAPTWTSNLNEHTLNIPNANGVGVTAGLISKAEYDVFDGKQDAITTGAASEYLKGDLSLGTFATDVAATAAVSANTAASHSAVTIGTANGLSVAGQALSMATADGATTGTLTSADWTTFNNKAADADVLKKNGSVALTADWNTGGTFKVTNLPTPTANGDAATKNYVDTEITDLGLGTMATQNAASVSITGGTVSGITDLAIADGGTGASTATGAINALLPSQGTHNGKFLTTDGTNTSWAVSNGDPSYGSTGSSPNDAVYVDNAGNVGIGTTGPSAELDVKAVTGQNASIEIDTTDASRDALLVLSEAGVIKWQIGNDGSDFDKLNFGYGSPVTNSLTILQGGNVGIGTTTPNLVGWDANDTVVTIKGVGSATEGVIELAGLNTADQQSVGRISFVQDLFAGAGPAQIDGYRDVGNGIIGLRFSTDDTERMRIDRFGNVGIGTSTGNEALTVAGDIKVLGLNRLHFSNTSDRSYIGAPASDMLAFGTSGAEAVRINTLGNVGIGTTSPGSKFSVYGSVDGSLNADVINASTGTSALANLAVSSDLGALKIQSFGSAYSSGGLAGYTRIRSENQLNGLIIEAGGAKPMSFRTNSIDRVSIDSLGNVGIGTTIPNDKLDVVGNAEISGNLKLGWERVSSAGTVITFGTVGTDSVSCTAGKQVMSGGCFIGTSNPVYLIQSYPSNSTDWTCRARNENGAGTETLHAYAICARLQ